MTAPKLTGYSAKVLLQSAADVEVFDASLERLVTDIFETMYTEEGGSACCYAGGSISAAVRNGRRGHKARCDQS